MSALTPTLRPPWRRAQGYRKVGSRRHLHPLTRSPSGGRGGHDNEFNRPLSRFSGRGGAAKRRGVRVVGADADFATAPASGFPVAKAASAATRRQSRRDWVHAYKAKLAGPSKGLRHGRGWRTQPLPFKPRGPRPCDATPLPHPDVSGCKGLGPGPDGDAPTAHVRLVEPWRVAARWQDAAWRGVTTAGMDGLRAAEAACRGDSAMVHRRAAVAPDNPRTERGGPLRGAWRGAMRPLHGARFPTSF